MFLPSVVLLLVLDFYLASGHIPLVGAFQGLHYLFQNEKGRSLPNRDCDICSAVGFILNFQKSSQKSQTRKFISASIFFFALVNKTLIWIKQLRSPDDLSGLGLTE